MVDIKQAGDTVHLAVRVMPRADRNAVDGVSEAGALRIRLTAPPVDGAANIALIAFLADLLGVPKRAIAIVRGAQSRDKIVSIGLSVAATQERLRVGEDRSARGQGAATRRS